MSCRRVGASGLTFDPVRVQRSKGTRSTSSMANRVHRIPFQRVTLSCQIMRHVQRLANYLTRIPEVTVTTRWVTDGLYRLHMRAKGRTKRERERDILNVNILTCSIFHWDWENNSSSVINWCLCRFTRIKIRIFYDQWFSEKSPWLSQHTSDKFITTSLPYKERFEAHAIFF